LRKVCFRQVETQTFLEQTTFSFQTYKNSTIIFVKVIVSNIDHTLLWRPENVS
jgi:hypothetical protein